MLTVGSIPVGISTGYQFYHDAHADLEAATNGGAVVALVTIIIGCISYRLCIYFHQEASRTDKNLQS
jgi:hypothetical protein